MSTDVIKSDSTLTSRLVFLDYLRIFSFVSVLIGHKFYAQLSAWADNPQFHATPRLLLQLILPAFWNGGTGVAVFFIISGYIITHVLIHESTGTFLLKRIFRIYPLYVVAVICQLLADHYLFHQPFPGLRIVAIQLSLLGDWLQAPYALAGVEWTLRIEIVFYLLMAALKSVGLLNRFRPLLPWVLLGASFGLSMINPIPSFGGVFIAYFTIYAPILFIGVFYYMFEKKEIPLLLLLFFTAAILYQYFGQIALYWPTWLGSHFISIAVAIFSAAWLYRARLKPSPVVLLLSNLTFAVYLFHNWAWNPIKMVFAKLSINVLPPDIQALFGLFILSYLMHKIVEKGGVKLGQRLLQRLGQRRRGMPAGLSNTAV
ncbi:MULTISPECIES: acyltransferase [unclassified Janthinobacterium]|uniref:acyltransferase family protein n=1 Tax=unclassified Janthinobacterium TaxID=2610881 RepID=UPI0016211F67|nr:MULTISPECIES: acyltransferase [unclassified Janthinobacterium]MBB5608022.1 peptidoglycan/LPS O-acetylase OafA/YrhL [Janthinobacterium sp. S3T4]MBB5613237.1 peptidoglycan/LPS O-acetylase OafA/YrhL [Janthinobacterium sp. S3M3]